MDCLVHIFERLGLEDLVLGVPFTCKSWYKASLDPLPWKVLNFRWLNLHRRISFQNRFQREYRLDKFSFLGLLRFAVNRSRRSAVEITFPSSHFISLNELAYVSDDWAQQMKGQDPVYGSQVRRKDAGNLVYRPDLCPSLKILSLPYKRLLEVDKQIAQFMPKWKDLEHLNMYVNPRSFNQIIKQIGFHCKNFVGLKTKGPISRQEASAIATWLPKIKYLILNYSYLFKESLMMILEGCRELEELDVTDCRGLDVDDDILKLASHIKTFRYGWVSPMKTIEYGCSKLSYFV
ncbi:F-box/LRR-repeat protein At3g48880-like [Magnolia sinica]|uniref:F-box/LRR-repeat protein At3g48880-like n=1 Tax=Magnolia sinica TaxID=86752 RepID=UPI002659B18D|nr:F-box/LRR-repeat protein At3g48880-like [Magnolia sinica]